MEKLYFNNLEEAKAHFRLFAYDYFGEMLLKKNIDVRSFFDISINQLKEVVMKLNEIRNNRMFLGNITWDFYKQYDFEIFDKSKSRVIYPYHMRTYIQEVIDLLNDRINYLEQREKVTSIKELVKELPENDVKERLSIEIKELEAKKEELELNKASEREIFQEQIELSKHRTEIMEKKYDIFLKFLNRESVASMVGSVLLLLMGISLLVMMFLQKEPIKIVESAFLLILGYFFGHSKNSK
ncbi:hypothetical protein CEY12_06290 [Chryseobacterium sp. T16E-39]|uniref:hypothetical protein n=1 Tax=Chryseobacterium sp. T16E-39 TaxID=2015076 RepID=UPI000B5B4098|nr:hypothetical protein [Chryseobacterium sp. T16E-39]ASK29738.1 hypothetical protein CEY12_06290 [Chryseobacterium sp. T16E-39]